MKGHADTPGDGERPCVPSCVRRMPPHSMCAAVCGRRACAPAPPDGWFSVPVKGQGARTMGHAFHTAFHTMEPAYGELKGWQ
ncbi:hypothetical protein SALBM311S_00074 [Streptomyces alboniger]